MRMVSLCMWPSAGFILVPSTNSKRISPVLGSSCAPAYVADFPSCSSAGGPLILNSRAVASPIPLLPPVIMATSPKGLSTISASEVYCAPAAIGWKVARSSCTHHLSPRLTATKDTLTVKVSIVWPSPVSILLSVRSASTKAVCELAKLKR